MCLFIFLSINVKPPSILVPAELLFPHIVFVTACFADGSVLVQIFKRAMLFVGFVGEFRL